MELLIERRTPLPKAQTESSFMYSILSVRATQIIKYFVKFHAVTEDSTGTDSITHVELIKSFTSNSDQTSTCRDSN